MGNTYFQFKQFRIDQDRCAMKVCTDSCLFGAWIPLHESIKRILDIGTGTGLLALIMAQRTHAEIDAVEIEPEAYQQATENVQASPWKGRVQVFHTDIASFSTEKKYDLIICNPPFYEDNLESEDDKEKIAKHAGCLTLNKLLDSINTLTGSETKLALLLPYFRKEKAIRQLENFGWYPEVELSVKNREGDTFFRYMVLCTRQVGEQKISEEMTIYKNAKEYTPVFTGLLSHFYF